MESIYFTHGVKGKNECRLEFYHAGGQQLYVQLSGTVKGICSDIPLDPDGIAKVIQVLRGERESIDDGKGIFGKDIDENKVFRLRHKIDPVPCFVFTIVTVDADTKKDIKGEWDSLSFTATPSEALALQFALQGFLASLLVTEY